MVEREAQSLCQLRMFLDNPLGAIPISVTQSYMQFPAAGTNLQGPVSGSLGKARHLSRDARRLRQSLRAIQYVTANLQNPREQTGIATPASNFLSVTGEAFNFGDLAAPPELARQINRRPCTNPRAERAALLAQAGP